MSRSVCSSAVDFGRARRSLGECGARSVRAGALQVGSWPAAGAQGFGGTERTGGRRRRGDLPRFERDLVCILLLLDPTARCESLCPKSTGCRTAMAEG